MSDAMSFPDGCANVQPVACKGGCYCGQMEMIIRRATLADIPHLMRMGTAFHASLPYLKDAIPFDADTFGQRVYGMIPNVADNSAIFVAEKNGIPCGMAAAVVCSHWFNRNHRAAQEIFWWVDEDARRSSAGVRLFDALEDWVSRSGAQSMTVSSTSAENAPKVRKFFKRRGFVQNDINFVKGVIPCQRQS